jgi:hypothetical protein
MVTGGGAGPPDERYARVKARAVKMIKEIITKIEEDEAAEAQLVA